MSKQTITLADMIANLGNLETNELKELITRATALLSDEDLLSLRPVSEPVKDFSTKMPEKLTGSSFADPEEAFKKKAPKPGSITINPLQIRK